MRSKLRKKETPPSSSKEAKVHSKETASASHLPEKKKRPKKSFFSFPFFGTGSAEWVRREGRGRRGRRKVQLRRREEEEDEKKRHKSRRRRKGETDEEFDESPSFFLVCPKERRNCGKAIILPPLFVFEAFYTLSQSTERTVHNYKI